MQTLKKVVVFIFFITLSFNASSQHKKFKLVGLAEKSDEQLLIVLKKFNFLKQNYLTLQTVKLNAQNKFEFTLEFKEPSLYQIDIGTSKINIAVDTPMDFALEFKNGQARCINSPINNQMNNFATTLNHWQEKHFGQMKKDLAKAMEANDKDKIALIESQIPAKLTLFKKDFHDFIEGMGTSVAVYEVLQYWDSSRDKGFVVKTMNKFISKNPDWGISKHFSKELTKINTLSIGEQAPIFSAKEMNGQVFNLTQWKGKYVLIDFWASWCQACRLENPKLVKVYHQLHEKGFEIVGITRDDKEEAWLKAIDKDQLPWTQIFESKEVVNLYRINSLPQNILIDPSGKIIGKNLKAEELEKLLNASF